MKIILEREKCIGCGSCAVICPKYFELVEDGKSHIKGALPAQAGEKKPARNASHSDAGGEVEELETDKLECAESAVEACPAQCIKMEK